MSANTTVPRPLMYFDFGWGKRTEKQMQGQTYSLFGAAEDLIVPLCYLTIAAIGEPGLQAVDGLPTATIVADPRFWEEAGRVSGPCVATVADVVEILRSGQFRWERNVGHPESVQFCLC